jgi:acetoin utilization protein AcuC
LRAINAVKTLNLPWVALGGGGYNIANVCRAWTLALALMVGEELPDHVPDEWRKIAQPYGVLLYRLRDAEPTSSSPTVRADIERVIQWLKRHHPLLAR